MISYEVLAVGAPICDTILPVNDAFLETIPGKKRGMQPIDLPTLQQLIALSEKTPLRVAGGSAANTIKGLGRLGHQVAFAGTVGRDEAGIFARARLVAAGVTPLLTQSDTPTSQVLCLVAPDRDRTFRSYNGAGGQFRSEDLRGISAKHVHIEGYAITNHHVVEEVIQIARGMGATISYDLGSHELVETHLDRVVALVKDIDIVFCNRDELAALDGAKLTAPLVVELMGSEGCEVNGVRYPAYPAHLLDSTGAGDLFASGFLHGFLAGRIIQECAHYGAVLGAAVVEEFGAEIADARWPELTKSMGC